MEELTMSENKDDSSVYSKLGVDARKKVVHKIFGKIVENIFPSAFVNIIDHPTQPGIVLTQHMDGDGSKFIQRILMYLETGESGLIGPAVIDGMEMNMGDIAASGFVDGPIIFTDTININGLNVPKDVIIGELAVAFNEAVKLYKEYGFNIHFLGGETADLPDQVNSVVFDVAVYAETKKENVITGNIKDGDVIYGFESDGQAIWEDEPNSGLMSNGSTMARTISMSPEYSKKYPFLVRSGGKFEGLVKTHQPLAKALISPTRRWSIVIKVLIDRLRGKGILHQLHGITLNTGGGATKISNIGKGIVYYKKMPTPPALFQTLQSFSGETWENMYTAFNCGIGIDVVGEGTAEFQKTMKDVSAELHILSYKLGHCGKSKNRSNAVVLDTQYGRFEYE